MPGLSQAERLARLINRLSDRDRHVVLAVVKLRFVSTGQLARLFFADIDGPRTRIRQAQRTVERLSDLGLLHRLQRRMGGVRAGSSGYVSTPTREAVRVADLLTGRKAASSRSTLEPGSAFVDHGLAASELFVAVVEADRAGRLQMLEHQSEPDCWRQAQSQLGPLTLRPDAFAAIGVGNRELRWFVEIDLGTEGSRTLERKLQNYVDYYRSGSEQQRHGVFPRVLLACRHPRRIELLDRLIGDRPEADQRLFVTSTLEAAPTVLAGGTA